MLETRSITLRAQAPFDFAQSLQFLGMFPPTSDEQSIIDQQLTKAVLIDRQAVALQLSAAGSPEQPKVALRLHGERPIDDATASAAADIARRFLSLEDDLREFYDIGGADARFAPLIAQLYGYHHVKFLTPFECACWAILTQRTAMPIARTFKQALIARYGGHVSVAGRCYSAFPEPQALAEADADELQALLKNQRRASYMLGAAQAFQMVDEGWLRSAPQEEVLGWLRQIPGIGPWSATFILLRGIGRMGMLPSSEARLAEAAGRVYGDGRPLDEQQMERIAEPYGRWRGYWAHYLRIAG